MTRNSFLYIYLSNTNTQYPVYFDDMNIIHKRGPLLEEAAYCPFGLTMAGISSKASSFGEPQNKRKFTSQEFDDELDWNTYQMRWRTMDPQTGRFLQIDPLANQYVHNSTFAYAENDVIRAIDIEGLEKYIVTNTYYQSPNGKVELWSSEKHEVNNPHNLGGGTLYNNYTWHGTEKGVSGGEALNIYVPEKKSFLDKVKDLLGITPQVMIFGSGKDASDNIGSDPNYSKPIEVFNFK